MKRSFSSRSFVTSLVAMLGLALFGLNAVAHAVPIGAGAAIEAPLLGDADPKMNIDKSAGGFPNLAAGIYDVTDFKYGGAGGTGDLQPFLAKLTADVNVYEVLWVGPTISAAGIFAVTTVPYAAGTEQFTLAEATDVYAGYNGAGRPVRFGRPAGPNAHNDGDFSIMAGGNTPSFPVPDFGANRTYAFEINVDPVAAIPEPSSLLLATIALAGLVCAFRRRRRRA
jgi:hypothetical protein